MLKTTAWYYEFTNREADTTIAALRLYQMFLEGRWSDIERASEYMREIATNGGSHDALSVDEISQLLSNAFAIDS